MNLIEILGNIRVHVRFIWALCSEFYVHFINIGSWYNMRGLD